MSLGSSPINAGAISFACAKVPAISVAQFLPTVQALTETLDIHGYQLILGQSGYDHSREEKLINTIISRRPDGIVVTGLIHSERVREQLRRLGIPVVETWDLTDRPVDMTIGFSHVKVGSAVAGYFLSKGWQRLGIATGDDHRASMRRDGFLAAVGHEQDPKVQAIYCSSDGLAQGLLVEAQSRGLRVPEDLAICGFGDADFAAHLQPSLSTVHVDGKVIGTLAAQMIIDRCNGKTLAEPIVDLGCRIIERQSTGGAAVLNPEAGR